MTAGFCFNPHFIINEGTGVEMTFRAWVNIRCGYTGHFLTWEIALLPSETAFSSVTDVSRGKFPVLNIHGYVKKITRSAHDI